MVERSFSTLPGLAAPTVLESRMWRLCPSAVVPQKGEGICS